MRILTKTEKRDKDKGKIGRSLDSKLHKLKLGPRAGGDSLYSIRGTGLDASQAPQDRDNKIFSDIFHKTYFSNPPLIRQLAPMIEKVEFDGRITHETVSFSDMEDAHVGWEPREVDDIIEATPTTVEIPQIFKTSQMSRDAWKQTIGGKDRKPLIKSGLTRKVREKEEVIGFQGVSSLSVSGLVSSSTEEETTAGKWDVEDDSDGRLSHAFEDIKALVDSVVSETKELVPIDVILTSYAYDILDETELVYEPYRNNLDWLTRLLHGGSFFRSDWIQSATVTANANTALALPRLPQDSIAWELLSSGIEVISKEVGYWNVGIAVREKFVVKILNGSAIAWMDSIDTTT